MSVVSCEELNERESDRRSFLLFSLNYGTWQKPDHPKPGFSKKISRAPYFWIEIQSEVKTTSSPEFAEQTLIGRLQQGERAAFAELYDRYGRNLYAVIVEIVQSEGDAEHLLQDVFVKIWRNIHRYEAAKGRLYTWLLVVARRVALDFVRSRHFSQKQMIQPVESAVSVESQAPEMQRLDHIGLESAVAHLEPHLRQVIDLQYFMGYTQQEVADETGLPLGTVKSRTRAALQHMRQQLSFES